MSVLEVLMSNQHKTEGAGAARGAPNRQTLFATVAVGIVGSKCSGSHIKAQTSPFNRPAYTHRPKWKATELEAEIRIADEPGVGSYLVFIHFLPYLILF